MASVGLMATPLTSHALGFNFTSTGNAQADAGFAAAGARWSSLFRDPVTVNITIGFSALSPGILGQASSAQANYSYSAARGALVATASSAADATAVAHLPVGSIPLYINRTSDNPNGAGSAVPYLDNNGSANNSTIRMSNANAKALGLMGANNAAQDSSITFSTAYAWDFDPTDGIAAAAYDFVGIATHEIGHALGFISGVDILDTYSPPRNGPFFADDFTFVSTLDLFRHSAAAGKGVVDWTADSSEKYFSLDGGVTLGAFFATGVTFGDGRQASHFKDNLGLGIMDPTTASGEMLSISQNDILALDAIGWTPASPGVADKGTSFSLMLLALTAMAGVKGRPKA